MNEHRKGAIKNTANLGTAFWSFIIALHTFNLLFLRARATRIGCWLTLTFVWTLVLFLVTIGPFVIERLGARFRRSLLLSSVARFGL